MERESANYKGFKPYDGAPDSTLRYYGNGLTSASSDATVQAVLAAQKLSSGPVRPPTSYYGYGIGGIISPADMKAARTAQNLSADAMVFKPQHDNKESPMKYLNCNSSPDDQPIIVNSSSAANKKGKDKCRDDTQDPVGAKSRNTTPPAARDTFTTDVGPKVTFQGGHYLRIDGVKVTELDSVFQLLIDDVSVSCYRS